MAITLSRNLLLEPGYGILIQSTEYGVPLGEMHAM